MQNLNLSSFKQSGVYNIEVDNTVEQQELLSSERLVIGFSRKGPFNTITRIRNINELTTIYGDIDTFLEKRGSFFHRSIQIALQEGVVLALNLLPIDESENTTDKVEYASLSTSVQTYNSEKIKELYSSFYEKEKFWKPTNSQFLSVINSNILSEDSILSFVNLSQEKYSILIRKSKANNGFDIYAKDYYGLDNVPYYIDSYDKINDYFVDVLVLYGDYTDYNRLSTDPIYSKYFSPSGLKKEQFNSVINSEDFRVLTLITGTIIPDFFDGNGVSYSIDNLVNGLFAKTGLFCTINDDYLNSLETLNLGKVDLIGHSFVQEDSDITDVNFLSYKFNLLENLIYTEREEFIKTNVDVSTLSSTFSKGSYGLFENRLILTGTEVQANITPEYSVIELEGSKFAKIKDYTTSSGNTIVSFTHPDKASEGTFKYPLTAIESSTNTLEVFGVHEDLDYDLTNSDIFVTDGISKFYFEIDSYSLDTPNNKTLITTTTNTNFEVLDTTYKVTWSAGYKILEVNTSANTITFTGKHDFDTLSTNFTGNVVYLKNNASKYGDVTFSSSEYTEDNNTKITLNGANVTLANGSTIDLISTDSLTELIDDSYFLTFGSYAVSKPLIDTGNVKLIESPSIIKNYGNLVIAYQGSTLYQDYKNGILTSSDSYYKEVSSSVNRYYVSFDETKDTDDIDIVKMFIYNDEDLTSLENSLISFGNKKALSDGTFENVGVDELCISSKVGNTNEKITIEQTFDNGTRIRMTSSNGSKLSIGDYITSYTITDGVYNYFLSPIITKKKIDVAGTIYYDITIARQAKIFFESGIYKIEKYLGIDDFAKNYNIICLNGFKLTSYHLPGDYLNKESQLIKILSVIENTGLKNALVDRNLIDYRYIVDTFDSIVRNETYPKTILTNLAKVQRKSIALINAPSVETFIAMNPPSPIFTDYDSTTLRKKIFVPEYISTGGNKDLSPDFYYSLPTEENGSKYSGMFFPYLKYQTIEGRIINIPPSAHISNLFMRKIRLGESYKISAGTIRGLINDASVIGVEYDLTDTDRGFLEPFGFNPIINKRNYGILLYGNQTAYQTRKSVLNNLHVRDNIISIERAIDNILERYLFENNTSQTRFSVYNDVNTLLSGYIGKLIDSFEVTINETNNTPEIINQNFGILDVSITPILGLHKFINILTIQKTAGVTSTGFNV